MYSARSTLAGGFPHSEISGSKLYYQLTKTYHRLTRLSSPVVAKASTTCTKSLDPIILRTDESVSHYRCVCFPYNQARRPIAWSIQFQPMLGCSSQTSHLLPNF